LKKLCPIETSEKMDLIYSVLSDFPEFNKLEKPLQASKVLSEFLEIKQREGYTEKDFNDLRTIYSLFVIRNSLYLVL